MRTLYFEGIGWSNPATGTNDDIGDTRIRTVFKNRKGRHIFLEVSNFCRIGKIYTPDWAKWVYTGVVDTCCYVSLHGPIKVIGADDIEIGRGKYIQYSGRGILGLVSKLGGEYGEVKVLHKLSGYTVFSENGGYNCSDDFAYNPVLVDSRERFRDFIEDLEKWEKNVDLQAETNRFRKSEKYTRDFMLSVNPRNPWELYLVRHYNGYDRKWRVKIGDGTPADWMNAAEEMSDRLPAFINQKWCQLER